MLNKIYRKFCINYYAILNISPKATQAEIKSSYLKLTLKYHPDVNPNNDLLKEYLKIKEAYETLSDSEKKLKYDKEININSVDFDELFKDQSFYETVEGSEIFRRFQDLFVGSKNKNKGEDIDITIPISLRESVEGNNIEYNYKALRKCPTCLGSKEKENSKDCEKCVGVGKIKYTQGPLSFTMECSDCKGQGVIIENACDNCKGTGYKEQKVKDNITIPPGVYSGYKFKLKEKGHLNKSLDSSGSNGDLNIHIKVEEDKYLKIENQINIKTTAKITISQSVLGGKIKIKTLKGEEDIEIPEYTTPGHKIILKGKGLKLINSNKVGDHIVHIKIDIPKKLSSEERKIFENMRDSFNDQTNNPTNNNKDNKKGSLFNYIFG